MRRTAQRKETTEDSFFQKIMNFSIHGETAAKFGVSLALILSFFTLASFYTPWTGAAGYKLSQFLLSTVGGAVAILLLFVVYLAVLFLFSRKIPGTVRQTTATLILFFLAAMLLGLNRITRTGALTPLWLSSGRFGLLLATKVFSMSGALGTFIIGFASLYLSLELYGIPLNTYLRRLSSITFLKKLQQDKQKDTKAPNIRDISTEPQDYFGDDTEDIDTPPATVQEKVNNTGADSEENTQDQVQDPEFSLKNDNEEISAANTFPPPMDIFGPEESHDGEMNEEKSMPLGEKIIRALEQFNIEAKLAEILVGPTVIQFRIQLAPGIKVSRVASLSNDIALAMAVPSLRIEAPIPGKPYVGIEIPNPKRRGIPLRTVIENESFQNSKATLPLPFGITVSGDAIVVGLEELPHLLIAGTTGSGKSVFINACIVGLCSMRTPEELRMILVDPKRVEMSIYDRLPHLLTPPVTDAKKAVHTLAWAIREMEDRYSTFAKARVRNLESFNEKVLPKDRLPSIVIVVDELADLMMTAPKEVEEYICRLAQMARATGIHLMLATQRPSVNVITGLIKANIPARVAFTLPSNADSRTIIDCAGAEKLLGKGDMLFLSTKNPKPIRIQSPWIDEGVLSDWLDYLNNIFGEPDFIEIEKQGSGPDGSNSTLYDDDLLDNAVETVMSTGIASASGLQRRLRVGFSRASRLIDMMEQIGIVGPADGSKPREILVDEDGAQELLDDAKGNNQ
jgi:S-DNA-T family DNA segregation ATPase FtsK/SpoIIIE